MKLQLVLVPTLLIAPLLAPNPVEAKTQSVRASNATASRDYQSTMHECEGYYAGHRGFLGKDRYAYIEQCFKNITGMTPAQLQINCSLRRC